MPNPIAARLRRWIPTTFGPDLHIIAADEIDRLTRVAAEAWEQGAESAVLDVDGFIDHPPNPYRT